VAGRERVADDGDSELLRRFLEGVFPRGDVTRAVDPEEIGPDDSVLFVEEEVTGGGARDVPEADVGVEPHDRGVEHAKHADRKPPELAVANGSEESLRGHVRAEKSQADPEEPRGEASQLQIRPEGKAPDRAVPGVLLRRRMLR